MIKTLFILSLINFTCVLAIIFGYKYFFTPIAIPPKETPTPQKTNTPTPNKLSQPIPTIAPDPLAGKCLIYVDGIRYDATNLRNTHSGGDIFQCGTDMSSIFHGQHPDSFLTKMTKYLI